MTIEEVCERIEELNNTAIVRMKDAQERQIENENEVRNAEKAMAAAVKNCDKDAYTKAKSAKQRAEAARDFYTAYVKQAEVQPVITETEYNELGKVILDEMKTTRTANSKAIDEAVSALEQVVKDGRDKLADQSEVLRELEKLPKLFGGQGFGSFGTGYRTNDYKAAIRNLRKEL